jgi:RHS repeat-associated protein
VPQQYTGKELDPETNLYYYGARYYDPRTQVWQTPDPMAGSYLDGEPNGGAYNSTNLASYTYAYNNPLRVFDPDGRFPWNRVMGGVKLVGGISEAAAGLTLGAVTSWTGIGAVAGGVVAVHGTDVAISGFRQLISGKDTSSLTSQGLQAAGVSREKAELVDSAISIVGSAGAGIATSTIRGASRAAPRVAASVSDDVAERAAPRAASSAADDVARAVPCRNSFTPDTKVLMADGSTKAIGEVEVGDTVLAADPKTRERGARPVTALIAGTGEKHLVELTVDVDGSTGDRTGTITATGNHPFWLEKAHAWVEAKDLRAGDLLRTAASGYVRVSATRAWTEHRRVRNLTVADLHTYYVLAAATAVLVHNCNFADAAKETAHYEKHVLGINKPGGIPDMPEFAGNPAAYVDAARTLLCSSCAGAGIKEAMRASGEVIRFNPAQGYFGARTAGGVIKTFFRPDNPAAYWAGEVAKAVAGGGRVTVP